MKILKEARAVEGSMNKEGQGKPEFRVSGQMKLGKDGKG